jgi:hypothetical protein
MRAKQGRGVFEYYISIIALMFCSGAVMGGRYSGGGGSWAGDPFLISTVADLQELISTSSDWGSCFALTADLDLAGVNLLPIAPDTDASTAGFQGTAFSGQFDGQGHILRNATLNQPDSDYVGLFGYLTGGVSYLGLENASISGRAYIGGICGQIDNNGGIFQCYSTGSVTGSGIRVGGLCGYQLVGTISRSFSRCKVTGSSNAVGGLCGRNDDGIDQSYATGAVTGGDYVGGLCGRNSGGTIIDCFAVGAVKGSGVNIGGLCGFTDSGVVNDSFWDITTSGRASSSGGTGKTTVEMKTPSLFVTTWWQLWQNWVMPPNEYPHLAWEKLPSPPYSGGSGVREDPFRISSIADWRMLINAPADWRKQFVLTADIDFGGAEITPVAPTLVSPGFQGTAFTGQFDGNNHVLRNFVIRQPTGDCVGLFGGIEDPASADYCHVKNLRLDNVTITGLDRVGGLCGVNFAAIINCHVTGSVSCLSSDGSAGGLCGYNMFGGGISRSSALCTVKGGGYAGGLCSGNSGGIDQSYAAGWVSCDNVAGGLCGSNEGTISDCYALSTVTGRSKGTGGLCGTSPYYGLESMIYRCYAAGTVNGGSPVGGLCGENSTGNITMASFWDIQTTGQTTSAGGTGKTTAEMKTLSTFLTAGWGFVGDNQGMGDRWRMCRDGFDYPRLTWESSIEGDFECPDGTTLDDLLSLAEQWLWVGTADGNQDGTINLADFAILSEHWMTNLPDPSLLGRWKMDGDYSDTATGNAGTPVGDPIFAGPAKVGMGAIELDGNDAVVVNGFTGIMGTHARTCMAWIKTTSTLGPIVYWGDKATTGGMWDMRVNSSGQLRAQMNGCGVSGVTAVNTGQWVHVAAVLPEGGNNAADVLLYVNGALETGGAVTAGTFNTKAGIAVRVGTDEAGDFFTGLIDDVRIYDRALTAAEIAAIAGE